MPRTSVNWSKYGIEEDEEERDKQQGNVTSVDWSKYDKAREPYKAPVSHGKPVTLVNAVADFEQKHPSAPSVTKPLSPKKAYYESESAARAKQLRGAPAIIRKPLEVLGHGLDVVQANIPGLADFQQGAGQTMGIRADTAPTTGGTTGKIARGIGRVVAGAVNPAALEMSAVTGAGRATTNLVGRIAPRTNPFAQRLIGGAAEGAMQNTANTAAAGHTSGRDIAEAAAYGAGGGAAFEAVGTGLGKLISSRFKRVGIDNPDKAADEVLALPLGRADAARARSAHAPGTDPIVTPYTAEPLGLPEPRVDAPTAARVAPKSNPYRQQFEDLMQEAQRMQADGRFTPGREDQDLENLWATMAGRDAPSLDELIQLAYKPTVKLPPNLVQKARSYQAAREVAGAPMPVKSLEDRMAPQGALAEAAPMTERIGRAPAAPAPEPVQARPAVAPDSKPIQEEPVILKEKKAPDDDDVADDLVPDDPEEVSVRVRDRVTSFADDLIANARTELAKSRNRLSSNPADVYGQYAKIMAGYMLKGTVKLADLTEAMVRDLGEEVRPFIRKSFKQAKEEYKKVRTSIEKEELGITSIPATELKDLSNINLNSADVYRNFRKVFGEHFGSVKKAILDPFDKAKGEYASEQKTLADRLYSDVVKGLGIKKGSRESALVQQYGEGKLTLDDLKKQAPGKYKSIVKADAWFRREYDTLLDRVNATVAKIYPNNPDKLVPKRSDYYRHFRELTAWSGIKNLFDTSQSKISPTLSGLSPFTQPKSKWASFKQKRGLGEFKNDAVGGFLEYLPSAAYAIHIDPHISGFRNLAKRLGAETEETANINNFIKFLNNYANDLSGKTSPFDRWVEELGGRNALRVLTGLNNRVKSNVILGNVRSTLAQLANIPAGIAYGGKDAPKGAYRTMTSLFAPNEAMNASDFLRERYLDKSFRKFDQKFWEQPKRFAEFMMELSDRTGTSFVWNTAYAKGVAKKVADPVKFADDETRRLIAGRGVGEQPLLMKSKVFSVIAPFQLEVANQWRVMKDFVDEKRFGALLTLFGANYLLNKAMETATGSGVAFDPIGAIYDASTEEDVNPLQRAGRIAGEVLSNVPLGQNLASMYPENGTNLYGADLPSRKDLFGDNDPTRFGEGLVLTKGIQDPLFKLILPFGGNQLKKSIQGADAVTREGAYTENVLTTGPEIENPKLKFPVDNEKPADVARGLLFGPPATSEGQKYYQNEGRPLSEEQTKQYQRSDDKERFLEGVKQTRERAAADTKIEKIKQDVRLSMDEKRKKINEILAGISQSRPALQQ